MIPEPTLVQELAARLRADPFSGVATGVFLLAIVHTFTAARATRLAHELDRRRGSRLAGSGRTAPPSVFVELLHFLGEVEVVFGLWAVVLLAALAWHAGWSEAKHYVNDVVNYTEALFVVVIMAMASTRPVIVFAEAALRRIAAAIGGGSPAAWWFTILTVGPILGSFVTEAAAMTICALLLGRQFYDLQPSDRLKYATLGLLFVNVSIGGVLTHFAAPPVLMVARPWNWGLTFMLAHFGWRAVLATTASTLVYLGLFRTELRALAERQPVADVEEPDEDSRTTLLPVPGWLVVVHLAFMAWAVANSHYPVLFIGAFLFFLGLVRATAAYQSRVDLRAPLLVGFFLAGLVIHGGMQSWWLAPVLGRLSQTPLFLGATVLTAFNDNALITFLATLVPNLGPGLKIAVVQGAVVGGGLTVIANAPNPAGQALLARFFDDAISPLGLLAGALPPTIIAAIVFRLL
jgi:hypothetical protein